MVDLLFNFEQNVNVTNLASIGIFVQKARDFSTTSISLSGKGKASYNDLENWDNTLRSRDFRIQLEALLASWSQEASSVLGKRKFSDLDADEVPEYPYKISKIEKEDEDESGNPNQEL
jgi:hypothetical protein